MKHSKKLQLIVAMTAIAFGAIAKANNEVGPLVVTASRFQENLNQVPADVKIISREEIQNSSSNTIPQVLSQIGGLLITGQGVGGPLNLDATVDMGGFGSTATSTTLILVDGQRLNSTDSSTINWESIPIDSIERIEILQGGASVQYGNGAVGGVINIITNGGARSLNQASATYGSFNTLINNAIFRNKIDDTTLQLSANTSNTNGWRQNSAASAYSFDGKITQSLGGSDSAYVDLFVNRTNAQMAGPVVGEANTGNPQLAYYKNVGSNLVTNNAGVRGGISKALNEVVQFEGDVFFKNTESGYALPYNSTPEAVATGASNTNMSNWNLAISPRFKFNLAEFGTAILGYDFSNSVGKSLSTYGLLSQQYFLTNGCGWLTFQPCNGLENKSSVNLVNNSIYAISRIPMPKVKGLELVGGYRYQVQNVSTTDSSIYAQDGSSKANQTYSANAIDAAFNYAYGSGKKIFIKWDQSFRFANTDEYWGYDPITSNSVFNSILKPQITQTISAGGDWKVQSSHFSTSLFQSISKDEIRYDPNSGLNINTVGNVNRVGLVFDTSLLIEKSISLGVGGKFQKSTYTAGVISGVPVGISPDVLLNVRLNYSINPAWNFGGVVNYVGSQNYDADPQNFINMPKIPAYAVADLYGSYSSGPWDFKFSIKNIGNSSYSTYAGYSSFSNKYFYYPSTPRSVFATVKYTF